MTNNILLFRTIWSSGKITATTWEHSHMDTDLAKAHSRQEKEEIGVNLGHLGGAA